jgi:NADH:ubiquinone oxidoreductase subunit 2 (subunit N)
MTDFSTDFFVTRNDIRLIFPYLSILVFIGLSLLFRFVLGIKNARLEVLILIAGALLAAFFIYQIWNTEAVVFGGFLIANKNSNIFLCILIFSFMWTVILMFDKKTLQPRGVLLLIVLLGSMLTAASGNLVMTFVGSEIALWAYFLIAYPRILRGKKKNIVVFNVVCAFIFIAGLVVIRLATGTTDIYGIKEFYAINKSACKYFLFVGLFLSGAGFLTEIISFHPIASKKQDIDQYMCHYRRSLLLLRISTFAVVIRIAQVIFNKM